MQSSDYVPGVSGWKIHKDTGSLEINGVARVSGLVDEEPKPKPFIVVDGITYISEAEVERASIAKANISDSWSVKLTRNSEGHYVCKGMGLGLDSQIIVESGNFSIKPDPVKSDVEKAIESGDAKAILDALSSVISETDLGAEVQSRIAADAATAGQIRVVIRDELAKALRAGGMLHRYK